MVEFPTANDGIAAAIAIMDERRNTKIRFHRSALILLSLFD
jgi:hypothetical protein